MSSFQDTISGSLLPVFRQVLSPLFVGNPYLAGLLITNVAWFVALWELYQLAERDFGTPTARCAVLALSVFPAALFGFVPYAEALFLACAIAAFRQSRQHHWLPAALLGGLAALTRQAGLLLVLPYLWEWIVGSGFQPLRIFSRSRLIALLPILLIPFGTALYALWLWRAVGDPLAFWHAQATWHRVAAWPWQTLALGLHALGTQPSKYFALRAWQEWLTVVAMGALVVLALASAWRTCEGQQEQPRDTLSPQHAREGLNPLARICAPLRTRSCARRARVSQSAQADFVARRPPGAVSTARASQVPGCYIAYAVPLYLLFLTQPASAWPLLSQSRFLLEVFPLFIVLGNRIVQQRWRQITLIAVCLPVQLVLLGIFSRGGWVL